MSAVLIRSFRSCRSTAERTMSCCSRRRFSSNRCSLPVLETIVGGAALILDCWHWLGEYLEIIRDNYGQHWIIKIINGMYIHVDGDLLGFNMLEWDIIRHLFGFSGATLRPGGAPICLQQTGQSVVPLSATCWHAGFQSWDDQSGSSPYIKSLETAIRWTCIGRYCILSHVFILHCQSHPKTAVIYAYNLHDPTYM